MTSSWLCDVCALDKAATSPSLHRLVWNNRRNPPISLMRYFWSLSIFCANPTHFLCSWGSPQVPQVSGSCQCTKASETEGSSLGGPRKVGSLDTLPSSSPSHSTPQYLGTGFCFVVSACSMLNQEWVFWWSSTQICVSVLANPQVA